MMVHEKVGWKKIAYIPILISGNLNGFLKLRWVYKNEKKYQAKNKI